MQAAVLFSFRKLSPKRPLLVETLDVSNAAATGNAPLQRWLDSRCWWPLCETGLLEIHFYIAKEVVKRL